jgi:hypothetical protein
MLWIVVSKESYRTVENLLAWNGKGASFGLCDPIGPWNPDALGIIAAEFPAGVKPILTVTSRIATKDCAVDWV